VIEFEHTLEEGKEYTLKIVRSGKDKRQTVVEDGEIVKDQLLHIKSIEIDEIDIGALVYEGVYTPEYPEPWATQQRSSRYRTARVIQECDQHGPQWSMGIEVRITVLYVAVREPVLT
jgi:hypothetical protein